MRRLECEIEVKITLKSEFYSHDGGLAGLIERSDSDKDVAKLEDMSNKTDGSLREYFNRALSVITRLKSTVNFLPRFGTDFHRVFLPGSAVKGVFRSALDLSGIRYVESGWGDYVESVVKTLSDRLGFSELHALVASLISDVSWLLVDWGDAVVDGMSVGSASAVTARRKVAELVCNARGGGGDCLDFIHRRMFLGLSELVFGTTGMRGAVDFSDFHLETPVEPYVKTYNAVAKQDKKVVVPFKLEHLPPGAVFSGKITIYSTPFISVGEVHEALHEAARVINAGEISIGGRGSVGFGRVEIRLG